MELNDLMREYFAPTKFSSDRFVSEGKFSEWTVVESPERLVRDYTFSSRQGALEFLRQLFLFEDSVSHHGKVTVENTVVRIEVYTHDIDAVTESDKEYAVVADQIFFDTSGL